MPKPETRPCRASAYAAAERLAGKLADGFDNAEMSAGRAGLADRQLPARGVERKSAVGLEGVGADERGPFPLAAETETFELQNIDHRIIVIGFDEIHVVGADASLLRKVRRGPSPSRRDTAPDRRERRCAVRWRREAARSASPSASAVARRITRKPSAPAHGITQSNRRSGSATRRASRYCSSVSGFLNKRQRIFQRVVALRDA